MASFLPWTCVCLVSSIWVMILLVRPGLAIDINAERQYKTAKPGKQSQTDDVVKLLLRQVESGEHVQPELIEAVLKQKFKLDQKGWDEVRILHDTDRDGQLSVHEMWAAIDGLIVQTQTKKDKSKKILNPTWITIYCLFGAVILFLIYAWWEHRAKNGSAQKGPDHEKLREARLVRFQATETDQRDQSDRLDTAAHTDTNLANSTIRKRHISKSKPNVEIEEQRAGIDNKNLTPMGKDEDFVSNVSESLEVDEIIEQPALDPAVLPSTGSLLDQPKTEQVERQWQSEQPKRSKAALEILIKHEKPATVEEELLDALSAVLNIDLKIQKSSKCWKRETMTLRTTELPSEVDQVAVKSSVLFERRLARECGFEIRFAVRCYHGCEEQLRNCQNELVSATLTELKALSVKTILKCLMPEDDEDDLWTDMTQGQVREGEAVQLLTRISGWSEDNINISSELLHDLLTVSRKNTRSTSAWVSVIKSAGNILQKTKRLDDARLCHSKIIQGLEILLRHPGIKHHIARQLKLEVETSEGLGSFFEKESVFGSLLSLSPIPGSFLEGIALKLPRAEPWTTLPGFRWGVIDENSVRLLEAQINDLLTEVRGAVFKIIKQLVRSDRSVTLSWLSQLVTLNELRTTVTPNIHPGDATAAACSDGFMLNVCSLLMDLCLPFCNDPSKLVKLDHTYPSSSVCSLNYDLETCLSNGQIVKRVVSEDDGQSQTEKQSVPVGTPEYNFMTEIFHITARAINVGFMPALNQFKKQLQVLQQQIASVTDKQMIEGLNQKRLLLTLRWHCHLINADWLRHGTQYYLTVAAWIHRLIKASVKIGVNEAESVKSQRTVLQQVPEFMVKDMAQWFWFLASRGLQVHRNALAGLQIAEFVECCVMLLQRPDIMPGPIPAFRITQALHAFMVTSSPRRQQGTQWGSGVLSDLAAMVYTSPAVQTHLGPALLHTYVSVDVVEGLDVDKEDFDKYSARTEIGQLVECLWSRSDFRASVLELCGSVKFMSFLGAILDTLLYQLHDSLARLANVRKLQLAKENETTWKGLSFEERQEKERFLGSEENAAKGFMNMATETLGLLDMMTKLEEAAKCFVSLPLAQRAASSFLGFFEALCGSKAVEFKVKDMDKYNFQPKVLLLQLVGIVLRIVHQESDRPQTGASFTKCIATDADYNGNTMAKVSSVLEGKLAAEYDTIRQFKDLVQHVAELHKAHQVAGEAEGSGRDVLWEEGALQHVLDEETLKTTYAECLGLLRFDSSDILENHAYQSNAVSQAIDTRSQRARALMKETRQWMDSLPIHPHAAIFLRQDEERMDVVRALVTGPTDTPYSLGCFFFDIYFPTNYPNIPPLIKMVTTGNGTVRFNPNLYADGKVCLSLLGTWHGGDASQKWQTGKSSLYQVLVSIQSMILISEPMYNEPGYDGMRGTTEGDARSFQYNEQLRLMTARHAILNHLRYPPAGFEDVVRSHFRIQKEVILKQFAMWLRRCDGHDAERKLRRVVDEIRKEIENLSEES